mgnify:CR=1 FL=1
MELKLVYVKDILFVKKRSNRTFMELKLINMALEASKIQVLIVPLWN